MDLSNTTTGTASTSTPTAKELKKKYGVHKTPLLVAPGTKAYSRPMNFDEQFKGKIVTRSWVIEDAERGVFIRANTYDGNLGERVDYLNPHSTKPLAGFKDDGSPTKERKDALKGYEEIDLSEVPFIALQQPPAPTTEFPVDDEQVDDENA